MQKLEAENAKLAKVGERADGLVELQRFVRNVTFRNISFSWDRLPPVGHTHHAFLLHISQDYKPDNPNKTLCDFTNVSFEGLRVNAAPEG